MCGREPDDRRASNRRVGLEAVDESDKPVLARLYQLYLHDQSEFQDLRPGRDGLFAMSRYFDAYWRDPRRYPYFIRDAHERVGFALVRQIESGIHAVAEYFVLRSARRRGVRYHGLKHLPRLGV